MSVIKEHLPENSWEYCDYLITSRTVNIVLRKNRKTKLGDYKYDSGTGLHRISLNNDLDKYTFLITLLHELAHYDVSISKTANVSPHGVHWKAAFKALMAPVLHNEVFPLVILAPLKKYMQNPKASVGADVVLWSKLNQHNGMLFDQSLVHLPDGSLFSFKNRRYKKIMLRRTRVLCQDVATKKKYLINGIAQVQKMDD